MESASLPGGTFYYKRTGPIVAAVNGDIPASEAQSLLASVNYDADVTLTKPPNSIPKTILEVYHRRFHTGWIMVMVALIMDCFWRSADGGHSSTQPVFNRPADVISSG